MLEHLYYSGEKSDVVLAFEGEKFFLHKFLLDQKWSKLSQDTLDSIPPRSRFSLSLFKKILKYFYTGENVFTFFDCATILANVSIYCVSDANLLELCKLQTKITPLTWKKALEAGIALGNEKMLSRALIVATNHPDCKSDASAGIGGLLLEVMKTQRKQEQQIREQNEIVVSKLSNVESLLAKLATK